MKKLYLALLCLNLSLPLFGQELASPVESKVDRALSKLDTELRNFKAKRRSGRRPCSRSGVSHR